MWERKKKKKKREDREGLQTLLMPHRAGTCLPKKVPLCKSEEREGVWLFFFHGI